MVQLDIPAAFAVSQLFAYIGRKKIKKDAENSGDKKPPAYYRYLFYSVFFSSVVIVPAGLYLVCGWPGWEQIYWSKRFEELIHTGWVNALFPTFFILGIVLAAYFGFRLAYHWIVNGKERYIIPTFVGVLVLAGAVVAVCYPSFILVGTYDQYHNMNGESRDVMAKVWQNAYDFGYGWLGVMIFFGLAMIYALRKIKRESKET